jgi:hypothetical protein
MTVNRAYYDEVAKKWLATEYGAPSLGSVIQSEVDAAVMAERERCAKIVGCTFVEPCSPKLVQPCHRCRIAADIRLSKLEKESL